MNDNNPQEKATKIRRFHSLLSATRQMEHKHAILEGKGVKHTAELKVSQLDELNAWLEELVNKTDYSNLKDHQYALFTLGNKQHMYLLSLCQQLGWTVYEPKRDRTVADLNHLGAWIKTHAAYKKPLLQMTRVELERTIYQFEKMVEKHFKS